MDVKQLVCFSNCRRLAPQAALAWALGAVALAPAAAQDMAASHSVAQTDAAPLDYRAVGARHLCKTYRQRIHNGKQPALMYAIAITETEIDENGHAPELKTRYPLNDSSTGARHD